MGQEIEQLAKFVAETRLEQIPQEVQRHARLVVLDTLGVILAGSARPEVSQLRDKLAATAGTGATVFACGWAQHDPRTAAFLNTVAGRAIELGEGHRYVSYQGAMQILPGVLAVGEWAQASGREMLAALILGYDVGARLAAAMTSRPLAHQNGQAALLGAAAAGARMRGLNAADTSRAMRIATTLVLTPSYNNAINGATTLNVAGGMSGFACSLAPDLALAGFTAQDNAIEEALGNLVRILKPGGHLLIFVPALQGLMSRIDELHGHFRRYHKPDLVAKTRKAGAEVMSSRYFDLIGAFSWLVVNKWAGSTSFNPRMIAINDKVLVPLSRAIEGMLTPPFGKNLIMVARKPVTSTD